MPLPARRFVEGAQSLEVPMTTVSELLQTLSIAGPIGLLKIDVSLTPSSTTQSLTTRLCCITCISWLSPANHAERPTTQQVAHATGISEWPYQISRLYNMYQLASTSKIAGRPTALCMPRAPPPVANLEHCRCSSGSVNVGVKETHQNKLSDNHVSRCCSKVPSYVLLKPSAA